MYTVCLWKLGVFLTDDAVFMMDELRRYEYVLNEDGLLWVGSSTKIHSRPWDFGQVSGY